MAKNATEIQDQTSASASPPAPERTKNRADSVYSAKIHSILDLIHEHSQKISNTPKVERELSKINALLPALERSQSLILIRNAETVVLNLVKEQPNLSLAIKMRQSIRTNLRYDTYLKAIQYFRILQSLRTPTVATLMGFIALTLTMVTIAGIAVGINYLLYNRTDEPIILTIMEKYLAFLLADSSVDPKIEARVLWVVAFVGTMGSIASILWRINSGKSDDRNVDFVTLASIGFFKPIIGCLFALFAYCLFKAGLTPQAIAAGGSAFWFYISLAFLAGFSEQFVPDLIQKREEELAGKSPDPPPLTQPSAE